ncbi:pyrroloquinoline quinone biosynthesis peptide chaperone PqqD [Methylomagnum sp.]
MALDQQARFAFSPLHRLQWEEAQQKHVILYPEGMVELNGPAAEILKLCDGTRNLDGIVEALEKLFEISGIRDDVAGLLQSALDNGWIRAIS